MEIEPDWANNTIVTKKNLKEIQKYMYKMEWNITISMIFLYAMIFCWKDPNVAMQNIVYFFNPIISSLSNL